MVLIVQWHFKTEFVAFTLRVFSSKNRFEISTQKRINAVLIRKIYVHENELFYVQDLYSLITCVC